ncbi:class I SAM-dependent methyltransferase [Staphylococcus chromogenes]|nr:class I SAM-dependent methyltransferase [Staphylococcus chromogenes]
MPRFADAHKRTESAGSFSQGADVYDDIRPGYPAEVLELLTPRPVGPILDVGAGTGKLTASLPGEAWALDPSLDMIAHLRASLSVPAWLATAESTALPPRSVAAATCAQGWHWVDVPRASAELDRVIAPGGVLLLVWNTIDVRVPWVHRLTRIMHAGDVQKPGFYPDVAAPWRLADELRLTWSQHLLAEDLFRLMATRSYWLRATEKTRLKMTANLSWYLYEHLGMQEKTPVELPYRCDAFAYRRPTDAE